MRQSRLFAFYTCMGSYGHEAFAGVEEGRERESETLKEWDGSHHQKQVM